MNKKILFSLLLLFTITLSGCQKYSIIPEEAKPILYKGLVYSIYPYTINNHQQVNIHNIFTNHNLSTTFIVKIRNTNETPVWTKINNSFVLIDDAQVQHKPFASTYPFLSDILYKGSQKELSSAEIRNMNLELERLQERDISSSNLYLYEEEIKTLQTKIYNVERNQLLQMEIQKTEKEIDHIIKTTGFKDQLIYPNSEIVSIIIFPAILDKTTQGFKINFSLDNDKTVTIPFKLLQSN
ncbi:MAG: hypothetical protein WCH76_02085 [Candidatus Riflemargulisbacteria bacterium]